MTVNDSSFCSYFSVFSNGLYLLQRQLEVKKKVVNLLLSYFGALSL